MDASLPSPPALAEGAVGESLDQLHLLKLLEFTERSHTTPFGAMIVHTDSGDLLQASLNMVIEECDPTAHAELRAIRLSARQLGGQSLVGYTLYTTCEPCAMCMGAALWARLDRVVYGASIEDANLFFDQIRIDAAELVERGDIACLVHGPMLRVEFKRLFAAFPMLQVSAPRSIVASG